jgi:hypothetical protein
MANPLSNPSQRSEPGPGSPNVNVRRAGTQSRVATVGMTGTPSSGSLTRGRAATTTGAGTEDRNAPESGRARQDAARGTVHGQPRSGYKDFDPVQN